MTSGPKTPKNPPKPNLSKTSIDTFDRCQRRYALQYLYWSAPVSEEFKRVFRFQSKLMPHEALAGQLVDDVITAAIRRYVKLGEWPAPDRWMKAARSIHAEYLDKTKAVIDAYRTGGPLPDHMDRNRPERKPLLRLFYDEPPTQQEEAEMWLHVEQCLSNFLESNVLGLLVEHPVETWKPPGINEVPWFTHKGIPIYSKYDFAIHGPGITWIFDWKTGKPGPWAERDARRQLHTYALYAQSSWGADLASTKLSAVWLATGPECLHEESVSDGVIAELEQIWQDRIVELRQRKRVVDSREKDLFEAFPTTGFPNECLRCPFRACEMYAQAATQADQVSVQAKVGDEAMSDGADDAKPMAEGASRPTTDPGGPPQEETQ